MKTFIFKTREDWLKWRLQGLGASDAPAYMGVSPWTSPFALWQEKTRRKQSVLASAAMERGIALEPIARKMYQEKTGLLMDAVNIENETHSFLRASLDGLNGKIGLEIKCPGAKDHESALQGLIPEKYVWQLRHQMLVADLERVDYFSFDGQNAVVVPFHREEKPEKVLLKTASEFWELVQTDTAPELTDKDFVEISDPALAELCLEFKRRKLLLDTEEEKQKALKTEIARYCSGNPISCAGVAIQPITRKGNVNYKAIPELVGVNLEKYRAKATTYVDIRIKRGTK